MMSSAKYVIFSSLRCVFIFSPLSSNSFLPKEKGEPKPFSHREKVAPMPIGDG